VKPVVVLGTSNADKLEELRRLLKIARITVKSIGEFGPPPKVVENGRTFEANAAKKARIYSKRSPFVTLADDSGLCVRALNRRPGIYSARFAGPGCSYADNNRKLLRLLEKKQGDARAAAFHSVIAVYLNGKRLGAFEGICPGRIAHEERGRHGFGYDPVFIPNGSKKTYAEMNPAQKNKISHRARALQKAKRFLITYFKKQV
jgi:XTP/dITP diphosphohydrolase